VELRLLGPLELLVGEMRVDLGPAKQRVLLAALVAEAGRVVSAEMLIDQVWDESPPDNARNVLHTYVARVRRVLGQAGVTLRRGPGGYELVVDPQTVDLHRFRALAEQARAVRDDPQQRAALFGEALRLWTGEPLAGLPGGWAARLRDGLREQRLRVVTDWAEAELAIGNAENVVDELHGLAAEYPLSEPLVSRLVQAYHRSGRTAEALAAYARTRRRIVDELGAEPGAELRAVHEAILRDNPVPAEEPAQAPGKAGLRPAQLPLDVPDFVGRSGPLARLGGLLDERPAAAVGVVSGTAGVGKTALAVHWAHREAEHFPDGQLYANLRGFDPGGTAVEPGEVVRRFLDALGVPANQVPETLDAQADLYRTTLADRRVLVLLDNARDAEQVRPLLPGTPGCLALVTSRKELTGLVADKGAQPVPLGLLAPDEARTLLAQRIGPARLEDEAGDEIVARCAGLPLALTIVAARAAVRPDLPLTALAAELRERRDRLDALSTGDAPTDLRTVFSWSYRALRPDAARLFRLLGLHPGPDVSAAAVASLAGRPPAEARRQLAELTRAHLVAEPQPGRYVLHDLLRDYAMELAGDTDTEEQRRAAVVRGVDHYLHTAFAAAMLLSPTRDPVPPDPALPGVTPETLADQDAALRWYAAEQPVLLSIVARAEELGLHTHHWQLAANIIDWLDRNGEWYRLAAIQLAAVASAEQAGDVEAQARTHRQLARPYVQLGRYDEVHAHLGRALDLYRSIDDPAGQANSLYDMGWVWEMQHRDAESEEHLRHSLGLFRQALDLFRSADHRRGAATTSSAIGYYLARLGDHREGLSYCQEAIAILNELGDMHGEAATWDSLGYIHLHLGDHAEALHCYERAVELCRTLGDRYWESHTLTHLGDAYEANGDKEAAATRWRQALAILTDLGHADADELRAKLEAQ
jgi:DNA-binding SARP family transcriptional activator/tetratricopeptide (TPR) repeat protein